MATTAEPILQPVTARPTEEAWRRSAQRARTGRITRQTLLLLFLAVASAPIILPYMWVVTISLTARTGGVDSAVLWRSVGVLVPAVVTYGLIHVFAADRRLRLVAALVIGAVTVGLIWVLVGARLHLDNYSFLWRRDFVETLRRAATAKGQFPSVWTALANSLLVAGLQTVIVTVAATLSAYYLSRFDFRGRSAYLQGLLILHAFPAVTLVIPIFLMMHVIGLLDTLTGVILVIAALELPFFIFVMKGFFDAVPWDIEMSAMTDGATRRQAFRMVVLPQVSTGLIAIAVFAFIRGFEEYIFVRTLLIEDSRWVMSLFLFWVSDDVMGVDYGIVAAVSVFYVIPPLLLYMFCQKYITQMTLGGIKG